MRRIGDKALVCRAVSLVVALLLATSFVSLHASAQESDRGHELMATLASFESDASSAQAYYDSLSEEDKALLHGAWANLAPDDSAPPAPDGALAMAVTSSGCTAQWATQGFYSAGVEQVRFSTGLSWC